MAGRLRGISTQGGGAGSHDFFAYNAANAVWNGSAFVTWVDANYASYRITATETGTSGRYTGNEPAGATHYEMRLRGSTLALSTVVWSDAVLPEVDLSFGRATAGIVNGTVGAGSSPTAIVCSATDVAPTVTDQFKGRIVVFAKDTASAPLRGQATDITGSTTGATPTLTVTSLTTTPASGDVFTIN